MFRKLAALAAVGLLFCATAVLAGEVKGKVTKVDDANNKITISVDGKETEYTVAKDCKFPKGRKDKDGNQKDLDLKAMSKSLDRAKEKSRDYKIVATTTKKDGKEVISEIKMDEAATKKKDKSDKNEQ